MTLAYRLAGGLLLLGIAASPVSAQPTTTSAGPGRIVCKSAASCQLGIGTSAAMHYQVDASGLPDSDKARLTKDCAAKGKPCVVTVEGAEGKDPLQVKASKITWYN